MKVSTSTRDVKTWIVPVITGLTVVNTNWLFTMCNQGAKYFSWIVSFSLQNQNLLNEFPSKHILKFWNSRKTYTSASLTMLKPLTVWITRNWKILKEMGIPDHLTCFLRNLYTGQETIFWTSLLFPVWFKLGVWIRIHQRLYIVTLLI